MERRVLEVFEAEHVEPGTLEYIKKLAEAGFINIVEVKDYQEFEHYDDIENLDWYDESFTIVTDDGKFEDGYGRIEIMLKALGLEHKTITEFKF